MGQLVRLIVILEGKNHDDCLHIASMDIVWLKRDVRLQDHGPFSVVANSKRPFLILYMYEPDQLSQPSVHGSHLKFIHEGLVDLDNRLSKSNSNDQSCKEFQYLTICHNTAVETFQTIHTQHHPIGRILAHLETGHWQSFMRDKAVRKWCRANKIPLVEFNQTGVTRCLKERDDYLKKFKEFISKPQHKTLQLDKTNDSNNWRQRLIILSNLPGSMPKLDLDMNLFNEIPPEHRVDRPERQQTGGTTQALATLESFLQVRGSKYSQVISSPNTSWTSGGRISPYLTWGHISLRETIHLLNARQETLRKFKKEGRNIGTWLRSLQAFSSRLHWRSHFIQKLESEPMLEKRDLCPAYQHLRRQEGDWNPEFYQAWSTGMTGYPFVDACMRCLVKHGWLNFRMRAMLVSFATYNLWLDWKKLAPHLARVFLDYEPGIHYPQLQMQSGTTGINAMRVYNVTKQGKDQDPEGTFIRKHVPELKNVPNSYIHEPWKMPLSIQQQCKTKIGASKSPLTFARIDTDEAVNWCVYPEPIVDEKESAKVAKNKVAAIRKLDDTKIMANKVYQKHGSRNRRSDEMNGMKPKALSSVVEREDPTKQRKISAMFSTATKPSATTERPRKRTKVDSLSQPNGATTGWNCRACTYINDKPYGLVCSICATPRETVG